MAVLVGAADEMEMFAREEVARLRKVVVTVAVVLVFSRRRVIGGEELPVTVEVKSLAELDVGIDEEVKAACFGIILSIYLE